MMNQEMNPVGAQFMATTSRIAAWPMGQRVRPIETRRDAATGQGRASAVVPSNAGDGGAAEGVRESVARNQGTLSEACGWICCRRRKGDSSLREQFSSSLLVLMAMVGAGAADRLRQRRESVDRARRGVGKRRSPCGWRWAPAGRASSRNCWWKACCSRWPAARRDWRSPIWIDRASGGFPPGGQQPVDAFDYARLAHAAIHAGSVARHRPAFRIDSGAAIHAPTARRNAEGSGRVHRRRGRRWDCARRWWRRR